MKNTLLQKTLRVNALFSVICSISLLVFTQNLSNLLGAIDFLYLQIVGGALVVFAVFLLFISEREPLNLTLAFIVTIMDWSWVVGSALLLLIAKNQFSTIGVIVVIAVAIVVGLCAYFQGKGIKCES